jgi:hypothetical protein
MRTQLIRMLAVAGLAVLLLTGCGSSDSDDDGVASLTGGDATTNDQDFEQQAQEWAQCMRDQGLDVPDPEVDEDGGVQFKVTGGEADRDAMQKATEKCGMPPGAELSEEDRAEMQDAALEFAQCLRDMGYDVPDPDFSDMDGPDTDSSEDGSSDRVVIGPMGDILSELDMDDPQVQTDVNECTESSGLEGPGMDRQP